MAQVSISAGVSLDLGSGMKGSIHGKGVDNHRGLPAVESWLLTHGFCQEQPGPQAGNCRALCRLSRLDPPGTQARDIASLASP